MCLFAGAKYEKFILLVNTFPKDISIFVRVFKPLYKCFDTNIKGLVCTIMHISKYPPKVEDDLKIVWLETVLRSRSII